MGYDVSAVVVDDGCVDEGVMVCVGDVDVVWCLWVVTCDDG